MIPQDITVDYFSSMPKLTAAEGKIKFDRDQINIEITHGKLDDLKIQNGQIKFLLDQLLAFTINH